MKYRIAKKRMKRNTLLNLWLSHVKLGFNILSYHDRPYNSEVIELRVAITRKFMDYEYSQLKSIQKSMGLRNYQFHHYVADKVFK